MKEVTVSVYHKGCFCSEVTDDYSFRGVRMKIASPRVVTKRTKHYMLAQALWEVRAQDEKTLAAFLGSLKRHKTILYFEVIRKVITRVLVFLKWKIKYSPFDLAVQKGFIPTTPATAENGIEVYTFVTDDQKLLYQVLDELRKDKNLRIVRIGDVRERADKFGLTNKQKESLQLALMYDYYSWPRKITLEELAHISGISRKVFQCHLRRAECKLFPLLAREALSSTSTG